MSILFDTIDIFSFFFWRGGGGGLAGLGKYTKKFQHSKAREKSCTTDERKEKYETMSEKTLAQPQDGKISCSVKLPTPPTLVKIKMVHPLVSSAPVKESGRKTEFIFDFTPTYKMSAF